MSHEICRSSRSGYDTDPDQAYLFTDRKNQASKSFRKENPKAFKALLITGIFLLVVAAIVTTLVLLNHFKALTWQQMGEGLKTAGSWFINSSVSNIKVWQIAAGSLGLFIIGMVAGVGAHILYRRGQERNENKESTFPRGNISSGAAHFLTDDCDWADWS